MWRKILDKSSSIVAMVLQAPVQLPVTWRKWLRYLALGLGIVKEGIKEDPDQQQEATCTHQEGGNDDT